MAPRNKPRLVILSQYFYPEENTTSWLMSELAFSLADDFEVLAIAGQPTYHKDRQEKVARRIQQEGVEVFRVAATRFSRHTTVGRILNTLTFTLSVMLKVLTVPRVDMFLAVTNPPLLHWIAAGVGKIRGIPVTLLIHDQYPEIITALGRAKPDAAVIKLWKCITGWAYRRAAAIISLGRCMTQRVTDDYGHPVGRRIATIPNWDDGISIHPVPRENNPLLDEWGVRDRFVVLYAGNIGLFHEIETVVDAAELVRGTNIQFVFVGDGAQAKWLNAQIDERRLDNIRVFPFRAKDEMPLVLTACDACLVTLKNKATGLCVPSKLYGSLASGKPVLCVMDARCETALCVTEAQCGDVVEPGQSRRLADILSDWSTHPERVRIMGAAARQAFDTHYAKPVIMETYRNTLLRLLRDRNGGGPDE